MRNKILNSIKGQLEDKGFKVFIEDDYSISQNVGNNFIYLFKIQENVNQLTNCATQRILNVELSARNIQKINKVNQEERDIIEDKLDEFLFDYVNKENKGKFTVEVSDVIFNMDNSTGNNSVYTITYNLFIKYNKSY